MKFRKRMSPIIRSFDEVPHEAIAWYRSENGANIESDRLTNIGFSTQVTFEEWWGGWFVWASNYTGERTDD